MKDMTDNQETLFRSWLEQYRNLIFKVVRVYATTREDQDDLFQEILLQLWISAPRFRGEAKESTWIYRVALNTALTWNRGEKRKRQKHRRMILEYERNGGVGVQDSNPTFENPILEKLNCAMQQIPAVDRSILLLHLDGVSYDQMAEVLGITANHAGIRLARAKKKLKEQMKGIDDDL